MNIIKYNDNKYPEILKYIDNPPKKLYYQGNVELLYTNKIAIVGARMCSQNGRKITREFAQDLVNQNLTIVSGMAIGIDSEAHKTTLKYNGNTIAVLPCGLKNIYPEENIKLYNEILQKNGLVITEYSENTKANSARFLERNRIVSGISMGVLIIEAMHRSGTSVTARIATEQGKKVFAIPHEIDDKLGKGTNNLIRNGAILVTCVEDIMEEFPNIEYINIIKDKEKEERNINKKEKIKFLNDDENSVTEEKYFKQKKECKNKEYDLIYQYIENEPITIEEIYLKTNKPINEINYILMMLEIEGLIKKIGGGYICV